VKKVAVVILALALSMSILASTFAIAVPVQASPTKTFTVSPSGGDDTANIQGAFDSAVAAGPRSTVRLRAGHFYCSNIFVENFRGTFEGAGRDLTVIDTLRGLDPTRPGLIRSVEDDGFVFFFGFKGGDIRIRDMTFDITAREPAQHWAPPFPWELPLDLTGTDVIRIMGKADSRVERVRFVGHEGDYEAGGTSYNVLNGLTILGIKGYFAERMTGEPVSGSQTVTDCSFEHIDNGFRIGYLLNSKAIVTRSVFIENGEISVFLFDIVNSRVEISYNQMKDNQAWYGVLCWQGCVANNVKAWTGGLGWDSYPGPVPANAFFLIHHNTINVAGAGEAIELWDLACPSEVTDPPGGKSLDAIISDNDIKLDTEWGGICCWPVRDVKVINNRITGTGFAGIYVGGIYSGASTGCVISGNTFKGFTPVLADIWLSDATSHCRVVASKGTTVLDEGADNTILTKPRLCAGAGPAIKNAMERKRAMLNPPP
jgi:hypothetical protein